MELASVIGLEFSSGAVSALAGEGDAGAELESALAALCRKQLIRRAEPGAADDFGFSHILVRDTAYDRLLKRTRARLHERFAAGSPARPGPGSPSAKRSSATTLSSRSLPGRARPGRRRRAAARRRGVAAPELGLLPRPGPRRHARGAACCSGPPRCSARTTQPARCSSSTPARRRSTSASSSGPSRCDRGGGPGPFGRRYRDRPGSGARPPAAALHH